MNKNIEKEYKVLLTKKQFDTLCQAYKELEFKTQINTYYDTKEMDVRKHKGAMRIRTIDNQYIFTLKLHRNRDVYEYETFVNEDSCSALQQSDVQQLLKDNDIPNELHRVTQLVTKRAVVDTGDAEICFDISTYHGITDFEIEYEYKRAHDGLMVFQKILEPIGIIYKKNCTSKIQRSLNTL